MLLLSNFCRVCFVPGKGKVTNLFDSPGFLSLSRRSQRTVKYFWFMIISSDHQSKERKQTILVEKLQICSIFRVSYLLVISK